MTPPGRWVGLTVELKNASRAESKEVVVGLVTACTNSPSSDTGAVDDIRKEQGRLLLEFALYGTKFQTVHHAKR
jgi:hypothetical protein